MSQNLAPDSHPPIELSEQESSLLAIARQAALDSPDRSRKTAAVIVDDAGKIVSVACNSLPEGVEATDERLSRPDKYDWTEHAERNAIFEVAKAVGKSTAGCTMIVPWFPCVPCARAIKQSGIKRLVSPYPDVSDPRWGADFIRALEILEAGGVKFDHFIDGRPPPQSIPEGQSAEPAHDEPRPPIEAVVEHWNACGHVLESPAPRKPLRP